MLYYVLIDDSECVDESEGQDVIGNTKLKSKQCITCCFYYFWTWNFRYKKHLQWMLSLYNLWKGK